MAAVDEVDDLRLYTKRDIAERAKLSERTLERHMADPACPLKLTAPRAGKGKVCDAATLRAYLRWLIDTDASALEAYEEAAQRKSPKRKA